MQLLVRENHSPIHGRTWVSSNDNFLKSIHVFNFQSIAELCYERYLIGQFE